MSGKIPHRDVGPAVKLIRTLLRGKRDMTHIRFADDLAARTQPQPNIPGGPHHKTSKVYYHTRDARRLVQPPLVVPLAKQITAGDSVATTVKPLTPGNVYDPPLIDPPEPKFADEVGQAY